jgi:ABC-type antimicrobial peptide transport system permease subunit
LAFPIYIVVGLVLELFYAKSSSKLFNPSYSFLASGVSNAISILLIAIAGLGIKATIPLSIISIVGFVAGGIGGLIASGVMLRVRRMYPAESQ